MYFLTVVVCSQNIVKYFVNTVLYEVKVNSVSSRKCMQPVKRLFQTLKWEIIG